MRRPDSQHMILRVVGKLLIPFVLLFALYVQFHGDYGPGGGFQAGVIFAAGFIVHTLLFGVHSTLRIAPQGALQAIAAGGVLVYALTGVASLLLGADFLDYDVLGSTPVKGQHHGILLVELGVGLTVASVMLLIFFAFVERAEPRADKEAPRRRRQVPDNASPAADPNPAAEGRTARKRARSRGGRA